MEKVGDEAATKFINALIKSVQTLCHGYLEFSSGIEIIGHINLMVDKGTSLDYILKEKVCKNAENSTLFISNSFHAEPKCEQEVSGKNSQQSGNQVVQNKQSTETGETGRLSSAISSISSALSGSRERSRRSSGTKDSDSSHSQQSTTKRKASDDHSSEFRPSKVSSHHDNVSHSSSESPFPPTSSSPVDSKAALQQLGTSEADMSETMLPQTANVTSDSSADIGVNLAGSVLEPVDDQSNPDLADRDDDSDGDLEVTFIKEEYVEGERSACEYENSSGQQFVGGPHQRGSESMPDPSLFPVALHTSSSASATYVPSAHDLGAGGQHFPPGSLGPSTSQPQPGPSSMRGNVSQQQAAHPLPPGARPGCGYVHPSDAQKWMAEGSILVHKPPPGEDDNDGGTLCHHSDDEAATDHDSDSENSTEKTPEGPEHSATKTAKPGGNRRRKREQHMCDICGLYLTTSSSLRRHRLNRHETDIARNPVPCSHNGCKKVFATQERMDRHVRSEHLGEKPHICQRCGKSFGLRNYLMDHLLRCQQLHYRCDRCQDRFNSRASLNDHRHTVHEGKVFSCLCGKVFKSSGGLRRHRTKCIFRSASSGTGDF